MNPRYSALATFCVVLATSTTVELFYDPDKALFTAASTYVSINVDSGSLYNNFNFSDVVLTQLSRNLAEAAPTQLRVGGGAADNLLFTGVGGARGACSFSGGDVCVDATYWDELNSFATATGLQLVWDINAALRDAVSGAWNSSNARALFSYAASSKTSSAVVAWQLGNEVEDWYKRNPPLNLSGTALAADYATLRALLAEFPSLAQAVYGIDACCENRRPILADFVTAAVTATPPLVSALTVHAYPIIRAANNSCFPALFTDLSGPRSLIPALEIFSNVVAPLVAKGVPMILGETATSAHGGCANLSNVFVAGFTFMYELGVVGERGFSQLNRQDLAGFSSEGEGSNYALLGKAGWASGPMGQPHPDYFTALLFKHLASPVVLNSSFSSADDPVSVPKSFDAHVWCARTGSGVAVLTFTNLVGHTVNVTLPQSATSTRRNEFVLTSVSAPVNSATPPASLYANDVYLNGELLATDSTGALPDDIYIGKMVLNGPISVPPWSYGLIVLLDAGATGACTGCASGVRCEE